MRAPHGLLALETSNAFVATNFGIERSLPSYMLLHGVGRMLQINHHCGPGVPESSWRTAFGPSIELSVQFRRGLPDRGTSLDIRHRLCLRLCYTFALGRRGRSGMKLIGRNLARGCNCRGFE